MLYQHKITGGLVEKISQHGEGIYMVVNANDEVDYVHEDDLIPHLDATNEKIKTEERLTAELQSSGDKIPLSTILSISLFTFSFIA